MKKSKSPCYQCEKRYVGCHSKCEEYISFSKENEEYRENLHKQNRLEHGFYHDKKRR